MTTPPPFTSQSLMGPSPSPHEQPARILVVDDSDSVRRLLSEVLRSEGWEVSEATSGADALSAVLEAPPDCILCDIVMPGGMDGYEVCRRLKSDDRTRLIPIVIITGLNELEDKIQGIDAGADEFLTKPFNSIEVLARVRSLVRIKRLNDAMDHASSVVFALAQAIEKKDNYTEGHGARVATLATELARYIGLTEFGIDNVRKGGVLHDIGKIGCPDAILNKPGPLTADEFRLIKLHPKHGWEICRHLKSLRHALPCIRWHHEKLDGSGYPDGLGDDDLAAEVRIMSIADIYDALSSARSYKPPFSPETCFRILREESEKGWWDKGLVQAFVGMMREKGWDKPKVVIPTTNVDIISEVCGHEGH